MWDTEYKRLSIEWAKEITASPWVVLHVSASGNFERDVVLQVVVMDSGGGLIFNSLIRPPQNKPIKKEWLAEMSITKAQLKEAPVYSDVREKLKAACKNKTVLVCSKSIGKIFEQTADRSSGKLLRMKMDDVNSRYASFKDEEHVYRDLEGNLDVRPMSEVEIRQVCEKLISMVTEMAAAVPPPPTPRDYRPEPLHYVVQVTLPVSPDPAVERVAPIKQARKQKAKRLTKKEAKFLLSAFFFLLLLLLSKCTQQ